MLDRSHGWLRVLYSQTGAGKKIHSKLGVVAHSVISATQEASLAYELEKLPEQWKELFCLNSKPNEAVENMQQEGKT